MKQTLEIGRDKKLMDVSKSDLRGYDLQKILGRGAYATVYADGDYAVKVQPYTREVKHEISAATLFSHMGVAPLLIDAWHNDDLAFLVTERWDGSMSNLRIDRLPSRVLRKMKACIRCMHDYGYIHGDVLPKNVFVNLKHGVPVDVALGDFGLTRKSDAWVNQDDAYLEKMLKYYCHPHNDTRHYMKRQHVTIDDIRTDPFCIDWAYYDFLERENLGIPPANDEQSGGAECAELRVSKPQGW